MKQIYPLIALAVLLAGGFFFFNKFELDPNDPAGPQLRPRDDTSVAASGEKTGFPSLFGGKAAPSRPTTPTPWQAPPASVPVSVPGQHAPADVIRLASFNIQVFGVSKLSNRPVVDVLARIVRNFDIVAVQEIRAESQDVLPNFLQAVNATGARYDYAIGERLGNSSSKEQYAYIFNTETVEVDRRTLYTVSDPDNLLHREPLVAWFRCRHADPEHAFTFSLVNVHTDPSRESLQEELSVLDDVFRAVRDDGRQEDDVIMLGDFNAGARTMGQLARVPNIYFVISGNMATNIRGNAQYDNLVLDRTATVEFLGRGGVFDFLRENNLSLQQAEQVSDHLPVWGEFSIYEGGVPGRVAARPVPIAPHTSDVHAYQPHAPQYLQQPAPTAPYHDDRYAPPPQYTASPNYVTAPGYAPAYAPAPSYAPAPGYAPAPAYVPQPSYTADPRAAGSSYGPSYPPPSSRRW